MTSIGFLKTSTAKALIDKLREHPGFAGGENLPRLVSPIVDLIRCGSLAVTGVYNGTILKYLAVDVEYEEFAEVYLSADDFTELVPDHTYMAIRFGETSFAYGGVKLHYITQSPFTTLLGDGSGGGAGCIDCDIVTCTPSWHEYTVEMSAFTGTNEITLTNLPEAVMVDAVLVNITSAADHALTLSVGTDQNAAQWLTGIDLQITGRTYEHFTDIATIQPDTENPVDLVLTLSSTLSEADTGEFTVAVRVAVPKDCGTAGCLNVYPYAGEQNPLCVHFTSAAIPFLNDTYISIGGFLGSHNFSCPWSKGTIAPFAFTQCEIYVWWDGTNWKLTICYEFWEVGAGGYQNCADCGDTWTLTLVSENPLHLTGTDLAATNVSGCSATDESYVFSVDIISQTEECGG